MKEKASLWLVSFVVLLSWCSRVGAEEVKLPANGDTWTEEAAGWKIDRFNGGCDPKYSLSYDKGNKKIGKTSVRIDYTFPDKDSHEKLGDYCSYIRIFKALKEPIDIEGFDTVRFWLYNPSPNKLIIRVYLYDVAGTYQSYTTSLNFTGWKEIAVNVEEYYKINKKAIKQIHFYFINNSEVADNQKRYILIDGLHYFKKAIPTFVEIESNSHEESKMTVETPKILFVPKVKVPPKIDGELNEPCWQKADKATGFISTVAGSLAKKQTTAYLAYDKKNLYIGFECQEPNIAKLKRDVKVRDAEVWEDDCIEIFLQPCGGDYFQFVLNTLNTQFDRLVFPSVSRDNKGWNPRWSSAISVGLGKWSTEIAIPFSQLKLPSPSEGIAWRGNLCRGEKELKENSAYFPTSILFNDPSFFGEIIFGNLSLSLTKEITLFEKEIKNINEKIKKENSIDLVIRIDEIDNSLQRIKKQIPSELTEKTNYQKIKREIVMLRSDFENVAFKFYTSKEGYFIWQKNPLDSLESRNRISLNLKETKEINLIMGMNEEEMVSLVISNFKDKPLFGRIVVSRFKDEKDKYISPDFIALRSPVFIELRGKKFVDDPLVSLNEINEIIIPSKNSKEIVFIVDSHNLSPGAYKGIVDIRPFEKDQPVKTIKFNISVLPVDLKEDHLRFQVFEIPNYVWSRKKLRDFELRKDEFRISDELWPNYIKDMVSHRVNVFRPHPDWVPYPIIDDFTKKVKEPLDPERLPFFNYLLSLYKKYGKEGTIINICPYRVDVHIEKKGLKYLSPEWKEALSIYYKALLAHIKDLGFSEKDYSLYIYDEIHGEEACKRFCEVCKIIREVNPNVKMFLTQGYWGGGTSLKDVKITSPYVDIWCPYVTPANQLEGEKFEILKKTGKPIWSYNNEIAFLTSSPLKVRKYVWLAWKREIQGIGSWSYNCWINDGWNDFDNFSKRRAMAYVYSGKKGPVSSRRWEALRETMEDYEVLFSLKTAIKEAKNKKIDTSLSQKLLNEAVKKVLDTEDPDVISQYKVELLKEIVRLQK